MSETQRSAAAEADYIMAETQRLRAQPVLVRTHTERQALTMERKVTKRGQRPTGDGWKLIHAWANPTDGALWLWQR